MLFDTSELVYRQVPTKPASHTIENEIHVSEHIE